MMSSVRQQHISPHMAVWHNTGLVSGPLLTEQLSTTLRNLLVAWWVAGRALHHTQHNMLPQPTSNNHLLSFESIYKVQTFKQQLSVLIDVVNVVRPSAAGGRTHDVGGEERSQSTDATWDCYRMGQCSGCAHWAHPAMYILNLHSTISFHQSVSLIIAVCFDNQKLMIQSS